MQQTIDYLSKYLNTILFIQKFVKFQTSDVKQNLSKTLFDLLSNFSMHNNVKKIHLEENYKIANINFQIFTIDSFKISLKCFS